MVKESVENQTGLARQGTFGVRPGWLAGSGRRAEPREDEAQVGGVGHSRAMRWDGDGAGRGPDAGARRVPRQLLRLPFPGARRPRGDLGKEVDFPNPDLLRG